SSSTSYPIRPSGIFQNRGCWCPSLVNPIAPGPKSQPPFLNVAGTSTSFVRVLSAVFTITSLPRVVCVRKRSLSSQMPGGASGIFPLPVIPHEEANAPSDVRRCSPFPPGRTVSRTRLNQNSSPVFVTPLLPVVPDVPSSPSSPVPLLLPVMVTSSCTIALVPSGETDPRKPHRPSPSPATFSRLRVARSKQNTPSSPVVLPL